MLDYASAKVVHVSLLSLSVGLFYLRALSRIFSLKTVGNKRIYLLSHSIDTGLLLSGLYLIYLTQWDPFTHLWLAEKLSCLLLYIGLGFVLAKQTHIYRQYTLLALATGCLGLIVYLARTKTPVFF